MKKTITFFAAVISFSITDAQQFSGGFRTGASHWMDRKDGNCITNFAEGQGKTWDKEIFIRYNTQSKFVLEAGMGHYAFSSSESNTNNDNFTSSAYEISNISERSQNLEWNLSVQYDLTCPALQEKCPLMQKMKSYMGVVISPVLSQTTTTVKFVDNVSDGFYKETKNTVNDWSLWTGFTHTLIYNLCEQVYVTSAVRLQIEPNKFFSGMEPVSSGRDSRLGMQVGLGYNFR